MRPNEVWEGRTIGARTLRTVLRPLSWLYALGWQGYLAVYRFGLKKSAEPHRQIVCIGNLVTGGSGKSPLTLYLAWVLTEMGKEVVIGCSGYGAPHSEAATLAPSGPLDARVWGDEPAMIRWLLPTVPLVVGRRRVLAATLVHQAHPDSVLLMDDGFQHLPLKKQVTIILDDPDPTNVLCLPAGPYREPRLNRARADLVLPGRFSIARSSLRLTSPEGLEDSPVEYSILCALGQPGRFVEALQSAYPNRQKTAISRLLPDHDPLSEGTLLASFPKDLPIVVTAKDWVKLQNRGDVASRRFLIANQSVRVEPEAEFKVWLMQRLNE